MLSYLTAPKKLVFNQTGIRYHVFWKEKWSDIKNFTVRNNILKIVTKNDKERIIKVVDKDCLESITSVKLSIKLIFLMNKMIRIFLFCSVSSFLIWLVPFLVRILFMDTIVVTHSTLNQETGLSIVSRITEYLNNNDKWAAFYLIFINNLKVCIINIFGGVFFGIGTFGNLFFNGFYTADVFSTLHANGISWNVIFAHTFSHSFEMIGIWISGGLGFFIAKTIFDIMIKNRYPTAIFYKILGLGTLISGLIILVAAYIEVFISIP